MRNVLGLMTVVVGSARLAAQTGAPAGVHAAAVVLYALALYRKSLTLSRHA